MPGQAAAFLDRTSRDRSTFSTFRRAVIAISNGPVFNGRISFTNRMKPKFDVRAWMREPLIHFILIGAAIFVWYKIAGQPGAVRDTTQTVSRRVVLDEAKLHELMVQFEQNQGRVPTRAELSQLVDDWVREEVLCRSALAAGVDRNDPVIRQRLMNLMQWYLDGEGADGEPGQDALRRYYEGDSAGATNTIL